MEKNIFYANAPVKLSECEQISVHGRYTVQDGYLAFDWSCSGFSFNFVGSGFCISLGEYRADVPAYVKVVVDGTRRQRFAVTNGSERIIIEGLPKKRHKVSVYKVTEGATPLLFDSIILSGKGAELNNPLPANRRKIMFIGDSITAGYGVLGRSVDPNYQTFQQDATYSYAFLSAEQFNADARLICVSGKGIVCNCEGNRYDIKAGEFCDWMSLRGREPVNDGWKPQVVVLNIGTNDASGSASDDEFTQAAQELLSGLRAKYPAAYIIWLYGMMNNPYANLLKNIIKKASETDERISFLFVESINSHENEIGANGHPNIRANMRVAELLTRRIRSVTGWHQSASFVAEEE